VSRGASSTPPSSVRGCGGVSVCRIPTKARIGMVVNGLVVNRQHAHAPLPPRALLKNVKFRPNLERAGDSQMPGSGFVKSSKLPPCDRKRAAVT
jgi:hypothetical protein